MTQETVRPSKTWGIVGIVLGAVFALIALVDLVRLPGSLATGSAYASGAVVGMLIFAALAVGFLVAGIRRYRASR